MRRFGLFVTGVFIAGCAGGYTASSTSQSDVDRVSSKFPGYTHAQLEAGRTLFVENCQSCHALKDPRDFSEDHLRKVVPAMVNKVNERAGTPVLDAAEGDLILKYMITMQSRS